MPAPSTSGGAKGGCSSGGAKGGLQQRWCEWGSCNSTGAPGVCSGPGGSVQLYPGLSNRQGGVWERLLWCVAISVVVSCSCEQREPCSADLGGWAKAVPASGDGHVQPCAGGDWGKHTWHVAGFPEGGCCTVKVADGEQHTRRCGLGQPPSSPLTARYYNQCPALFCRPLLPVATGLVRHGSVPVALCSGMT
jgi:hypothetical protein